MNNRAIRVLHVYRTYYPDTQGGLEEVIRQICVGAKSQRIESRIITLSADPSPQKILRDEADVYRYSLTLEVASCGMSVSVFKGFRLLVDWADIVHYHFPWPFADFLHLLGRVQKPALVTYHSDIVRQRSLLKLYSPLMKIFLGRVDAIVATSLNYFASSDVLRRYSGKVEVIPIGLDEEVYPAVSEESFASVRERVGEGFFLFVGVLRYYKGLHILLEAIQGTALRCVIVGAGPVERELKAHAARLGLSNIQFLGYVSDAEKVSLIRLCRAVVFPSHLRSEAFGITLLEGAMYGKPLISTEIGTGTSFINIDGDTGLVVPPADVEELRIAMLKLDHDVILSERMGRAARSRYEDLFTGRLMGERYACLYRRLLGR